MTWPTLKGALDRHWNEEDGHDQDVARLNRMVGALESALDVSDAMEDDVPPAIWDTASAVVKIWNQLVEGATPAKDAP